MIIFDENIEEYWIQLVKNYAIDFISIRDTKLGISDEEVMLFAIQKKALIVTEDKDFGNLVFAHGHKNVSVLLIRYNKPVYSEIQETLLQILNSYSSKDESKFMVLTGKKLRIRNL